MSLHTEIKKKTVETIRAMKSSNEKISCLTAYDHTMAALIDSAGVDLILVGDSVNMVVAGEETTLSATMDQMLYHTRIVEKACNYAVVIADMPFMSYQVSEEEAIRNAGRFMKEASAHGVKVEGGKRNETLIRRLTDMGIPVMGHLGLTPQSIQQFGSYKTRGKDSAEVAAIREDIKILADAGCFAIVLEKIPSELARELTDSITVPTIGIGAGDACDGQILVTHDMLGLFDKFKPKFVRHYNNLAEQLRNNFSAYVSDVKSKNYPSEDESY